MTQFNSAFSAALFLSALLLSPFLRGEETNQYPDQVLKQELLLNQLITNIHVLQLDFLDKETREQMREQLIELDANFKAWPQTSRDPENSELLLTVKSLWPIINRHIEWLSELSQQYHPPEADSLLQALGKLDRQLRLLRQKQVIGNPGISRKYRFLKQALMMQRLTREYLSMTLTDHNPEDMTGNKTDLQNQAKHFSQTLTTIQKDLAKHPHARQPLKQSLMAWQYIAGSIHGFPQNQVPLMIVRYGSRIVSKLASVQRMF